MQIEYKVELNAVSLWNLLPVDGNCGDFKRANELFDEMPQRYLVSWNAIVGGFLRICELGLARKLFDELVNFLWWIPWSDSDVPVVMNFSHGIHGKVVYVTFVGGGRRGNSSVKNVAALIINVVAAVSSGDVPLQFFVGGNWKCNGSKDSITKLISDLNSAKLESDIDVVVSPPFVYINQVKNSLTDRIEIAAQNCWTGKCGTFTGEISAEQLKDIRCKWVVLGHSERRHIIGEDDQFIGKKAAYALSHNFGVIACIGELLQEREEGKMFDVCFQQLKAYANAVPSWDNIVIAYEPVWAIGTGKVATPQRAPEVHATVQDWLSKNVSAEVASKTRIKFGSAVRVPSHSYLKFSFVPRKLDEALDLLKEMDSSGCARSVIMYNTLIDGFYKNKKIEAAEEIFDQMELHGVTKNWVTYNMLIDGLYKSIFKTKQHMEKMIWCMRHQFLENVRSKCADFASQNSVVRERKSASMKRAWPDSEYLMQADLVLMPLIQDQSEDLESEFLGCRNPIASIDDSSINYAEGETLDMAFNTKNKTIENIDFAQQFGFLRCTDDCVTIKDYAANEERSLTCSGAIQFGLPVSYLGQGLPFEEATWLDEKEVLKSYLELNLEDKVLSNGGGNVMDPQGDGPTVTHDEPTHKMDKPGPVRRQSNKPRVMPRYLKEYV